MSNTCKYRYYLKNICNEQVFINDKKIKDKKGYCIFHSEDIEGKKKKFDEEFKRKFDEYDEDPKKYYDFRGYIFPNNFGIYDYKEDKFIKDVDFSKAQFHGKNTSFYFAQFHGNETDFFGAQFHGEKTNFSETHFHGEKTNFICAQFHGNETYFFDAQFHGNYTDFFKVIFKKKLNVRGDVRGDAH